MILQAIRVTFLCLCRKNPIFLFFFLTGLFCATKSWLYEDLYILKQQGWLTTEMWMHKIMVIEIIINPKSTQFHVTLLNSWNVQFANSYNFCHVLWHIARQHHVLSSYHGLQLNFITYPSCVASHASQLQLSLADSSFQLMFIK